MFEGTAEKRAEKLRTRPEREKLREKCNNIVFRQISRETDLHSAYGNFDITLNGKISRCTVNLARRGMSGITPSISRETAEVLGTKHIRVLQAVRREESPSELGGRLTNHSERDDSQLFLLKPAGKALVHDIQPKDATTLNSWKQST